METKLMEVKNMGKSTVNPKREKRCAVCKRWIGNAELEFKSPTIGFQYTTCVSGKFVVNNSRCASNDGSVCKKYEPSVEASKLL